MAGKKINSILLVVCLLRPPCLLADYLSPQVRTPKKSQLLLDFETQGYYSHSNFTEDRQYTYIQNERGAPTWIGFLNYKLGLSYRPQSWIEFYPYIRAGTHYSYPYLLPFWLGDAGLRLRHYFYSEFLSFFPEVDLMLPVRPQVGQVSRIITSDDVFKVTPMARVYLHPFKSVSLIGAAGFQYRFEGLSGLLLWQAGLLYQDHIWEVGSLVGGMHTMVGDKYTHSPNNRHQHLKKFNSGSLKFYSVNPEAIGLSTWIHLTLAQKAYIYLNYQFDFFGRNYARGHGVNMGLAYRFLSRKSDKKYKKSIRRFKHRSRGGGALGGGGDEELLREIENLK